MRLDKWLKVSRLIKRRTVAVEVLSVTEMKGKENAVFMYKELQGSADELPQ